MIDIARLREDPEAVRENIKKKFQDHKLPLVDEALELDKQYRAAITRASELRSMRNKLSKEIGQFMREGKKEEAAENKKKVGEMAEELKSLEEVEKESGDKLRRESSITNMFSFLRSSIAGSLSGNLNGIF